MYSLFFNRFDQDRFRISTRYSATAAAREANATTPPLPLHCQVLIGRGRVKRTITSLGARAHKSNQVALTHS